MADIALLEPRVLNGVIEQMPPADGLLGHTLVPYQAWPLPYWEYDIVSRRRNVARPNTPNSPAMIVDQQGIGKMRGGFIYTREKKVFTPTVIRWLRTPGTFATMNAEREVMKEIQELSMRVDRFEEFLIWQMLTQGAFDLTNLGHDVQIDYGIDSSHIIQCSPAWSTVGADPINDVTRLKRIVSRHTDARANRMIGNSSTLGTMFQSPAIWGNTTDGTNTTNKGQLLDDATKRAILMEGRLPRFQGLEWIEYDKGYVDDFSAPSTPVWRPYIPNSVFVGLAEAGTATAAYLQGPSADDDAPEGTTGRFMKTWKEPDPSSRQSLYESNGMPVLYQPDHICILNIGALK